VDWAGELGKVGLTVTGQLGAGMDGAVFALADGSVAKVWTRQEPAALARLRDFYAQLDRSGLPFATPLIHEIRSVAGAPVTVERHLQGQPLSTYVTERVSDTTTKQAMRTFIDVLAALREVPVPGAATALAVMDEPEPFSTGPDDTWPAALEGLVCRRVDAFRSPLRRAVADLDTLLDDVVARLRRLPDTERSVIHGDLCTPNLLVSANLDVVSVLDWGYLSMVGDPAFDASLAAGFFDMYGGDARAIDETLTRWVVDEFDYPVELLALYRVTYALAGACAYDPDGRDGHFAWCVDQLRRPDLRGLLR
jgi:aminoglycoside phosphotransferase (APT) family kinase protein